MIKIKTMEQKMNNYLNDLEEKYILDSDISMYDEKRDLYCFSKIAQDVIESDNWN